MRFLLYWVLLMPGLSMAEIYRWTDAQGQVHFGQRPGAGAEQIEVKPQVVERDQAREERTERFYEARREEREQASLKEAERQAKHDQECRGLRSQLAVLEKGGRYYSKDAKGEPIFYSDTEIDTARSQLAARVNERCG